MQLYTEVRSPPGGFALIDGIDANVQLQVGQMLTLAGFGLSDPDSSTPSTLLLKVDVPVRSRVLPLTRGRWRHLLSSFAAVSSGWVGEGGRGKQRGRQGVGHRNSSDVGRPRTGNSTREREGAGSESGRGWRWRGRRTARWRTRRHWQEASSTSGTWFAPGDKRARVRALLAESQLHRALTVHMMHLDRSSSSPAVRVEEGSAAA
jgi:hypothetical protein